MIFITNDLTIPVDKAERIFNYANSHFTIFPKKCEPPKGDIKASYDFFMRNHISNLVSEEIQAIDNYENKTLEALFLYFHARSVEKNRSDISSVLSIQGPLNYIAINQLRLNVNERIALLRWINTALQHYSGVEMFSLQQVNLEIPEQRVEYLNWSYHVVWLMTPSHTKTFRINFKCKLNMNENYNVYKSYPPIDIKEEIYTDPDC